MPSSLTNACVDDLSSIRLAFQRLASLGLLTARPTLEISPSPSLLTPLLSPLLAHLHPAPGSPLPAYPPTYLPSLLLPLPASILASFVESLLEHLAFRLVPPGGDPLQPDRPDERIKRAGKVLNLFIGPAKTGGEAMEAVVRGVIGGKLGGVVQDQAHSRIRMTVAWIGEGGERGEA